MAGQGDDLRITPAEVSQLAGKLQSWAETLPEHEQLILSWIINRAEAAGEGTAEVSGYAFQNAALFQPSVPFSAQLATAAGFGFKGGDVMGDSCGTSWSHSFKSFGALGGNVSNPG